MVKTYEIRLIIETPYNPDKWNWDELIASEEDERILFLQCDDYADEG